MKTVFALAAFVWTTAAFAADIAPFTSDGCSSFPDGTPASQSLWLDCCIRQPRQHPDFRADALVDFESARTN